MPRSNSEVPDPKIAQQEILERALKLVWLNTAEVAAITNTSSSFWEKLRSQRKGPEWIYIGRAARMSRHALDEWLLAQRQPGETA